MIITALKHIAKSLVEGIRLKIRHRDAEAIVLATAAEYDVDEADLRSKSKKHGVVQARRILVKRLRYRLDMSGDEIADYLGLNRSSVFAILARKD